MDTTVGLVVDHMDQAPVVVHMDMALTVVQIMDITADPHPAEEPSV